jgi:hypothetical protein
LGFFFALGLVISKIYCSLSHPCSSVGCNYFVFKINKNLSWDWNTHCSIQRVSLSLFVKLVHINCAFMACICQYHIMRGVFHMANLIKLVHINCALMACICQFQIMRGAFYMANLIGYIKAHSCWLFITNKMNAFK